MAGFRKRGMQSPWLQVLLGSAAGAMQDLKEERDRQNEYARKVALMNVEQGFKTRDRSQEQELAAGTADLKFKRDQYTTAMGAGQYPQAGALGRELGGEGSALVVNASSAMLDAGLVQAKKDEAAQRKTQNDLTQSFLEKLASLSDDPQAAALYLKSIRSTLEGQVNFDFDGAIKNYEAATKVKTQKEKETTEAETNTARLIELISDPEATANGRPVEFSDIAEFYGKRKVTDRGKEVYESYQKNFLARRTKERELEVADALRYGEKLPPVEGSPFVLPEESMGARPPPGLRAQMQGLVGRTPTFDFGVTPDQLAGLRAQGPSPGAAAPQQLTSAFPGQGAMPPAYAAALGQPPPVQAAGAMVPGQRVPNVPAGFGVEAGTGGAITPLTTAMGGAAGGASAAGDAGVMEGVGPLTLQSAEAAVKAGRFPSVEEAIRQAKAAGVDVSR